MTLLRLDHLAIDSDIVHARTGEAVTIRLAEPRDAVQLQDYFRTLSIPSRYNRFHSAMRELPCALLDLFTHAGQADAFTAVATVDRDGRDIIIGETRYAFHADDRSVEFGLSIDDPWQGHGIGAALLANLDCRAAALGATRLFGDTLRSNAAMTGLARKSGFGFGRHPGDWKLVRLEKPIDPTPELIPCANWRRAAAAGRFALA